MNMNDFKERLAQDFEERLPDVYSKVKNTPYYPVSPAEERKAYNESSGRRNLKMAFLSCLVIVVVLASVLPVILFNDSRATVSESAFMEVVVEEYVASSTASTSGGETSEKPEINLIVFEGIITGYNANTSGNYLLTGETVKGLTVKKGLEKIASLTAELGYVGTGDGVNGLHIAVAGQNADIADTTKQLAKVAATDYFASNNVRAVVTTGDLEKSKLVEKAKQFDASANSSMTVAELNEIIENGKTFISSEVAAAYNSDSCVKSMKQIYIKKMFSMLSGITAQFVDTTYGGDRAYAEERVNALLSAYLTAVGKGGVTLGEKSVGTDVLTPWDVVENIDEVLATVDSAYLPVGGKITRDEKTAVAEFAASFKNALLDASRGYSDKVETSGSFIVSAFRFTTFDFVTHLENMVKDCKGFDDLYDYVHTEFDSIMDSFDKYSATENKLTAKGADAYLVGLESLVAKTNTVEKENAKLSLAATRQTEKGDEVVWASKDEYKAWASTITGE